MTIRDVKQNWVNEVNSVLGKHGIIIKSTSEMFVYDASHERGMSKKLWLCGESTTGKEYYFYMYVTKKNVLKKYNGTVYANTKSDFEADVKDYKFLNKIC